MPTLIRPCTQCGGTLTVEVGELLQGPDLRWYASYRCGQCHAAVEEDGVAPTPDWIRSAVLAEEGEWDLIATSPSWATAQALMALRAILGIHLSECQALLRSSGLIAKGTKTEVQRLERMLQERGVKGVRAKPHSD